MFLRKEKNNPINKVILGLLFISFVFNAFSLNYQSVKSAEFKSMEKEISELNDSISDLKFKVSKASSLIEIEKKAQSLGFKKINGEIEVVSESFAYKIN